MLTDESRYIHRNWRALDAEPSFFGVKGRFKTVFALIAAGGMIPSIMIWNTVNDFVGLICCLSVLITDYLYIIWIQGKMTERQFTRMLGKLKLPRFSRVKPLSVHDYIKKDIIWK